ncbi:RNA polymerase sigma factor [Chitinophaga defluvii]|uniref:Sigma-70 family RNA polymerase sigma factor n=1 Tax=Chitinophaga defluvii TaxID=3163343 RepID=A0ABV2TC76_9BACT
MTEVHQEDVHWWNQMRAGDMEALERLYAQYVQELFSYGSHYTKDDALLKDCIHDVFVILIRRHRHLSATNNVKLYLFKMLRHEIFRAVKKEKKTAAEFSIDFTTTTVPVLPAGQGPEDAEHYHQQAAVLQQLLQRLSARQLEAIYLRFNKGLGYEEISALMEIDNQSARALVSRTIKKMREEADGNRILPVSLFIFNLLYIIRNT